MALLDILTIPDPRLRRKAEPVTRFDADLKRFADDLAETMYAAPGIGLAATQVGDLRRVVVLDLSDDKNKTPLYTLVNPDIVEASGETSYNEGCLSVPGFYETVKRHERIRLRYQDVTGATHEMEADGLLAICIQHEIDHLEGKVFVDYLEPALQVKAQRVVNDTLKDRSRKEIERARRKAGEPTRSVLRRI